MMRDRDDHACGEISEEEVMMEEGEIVVPSHYTCSHWARETT